MRRIWLVLRTMGSRRWLLPTIVVILGMGLMARLGIWQLDRLAQRRADNLALQIALDTPPMLLNEIDLPKDVASLRDRFVTVQGTYDVAAQVVVKLQNFQGRPGVHLLTPLVLEEGETAVLINRGWIPDSERDNLAQFDATEPLTVNGYIGLTQTLSRAANSSASNAQTDEFFRVDIALIQQQMPYSLLPIYVIESPPEDRDVDLPLQLAREIDLSDGPHLSYAWQWFSFTFMLAVVYGVVVNKKVEQ